MGEVARWDVNGIIFSCLRGRKQSSVILTKGEAIVLPDRERVLDLTTVSIGNNKRLCTRAKADATGRL